MKFIADVNIPQLLVTKLIDLGHNVLDIKKANLQIGDVGIIKIAQQEERIILTRDKDFIALTQFPKFHTTTIIIRLTIQTSEHITEKTLEFLENQKEAAFLDALTIIKEESATSTPLVELN